MRPWARCTARLAASGVIIAALVLPGLPVSAASAAVGKGGTVVTQDKAGASLVTDPASLVNPFIGTTNGGDDFPGADVPFGMVQWSPDTPSRPHGGGYEYNDSSITGFSLTHLSGAGCAAEGDVPVLPTVGTVNYWATDSFSHASESAQAGYYEVAMANGVTTQLTATTRTGMAAFTFPSTTSANLIFKLKDSATAVSATSFTVVSSTEVQGSVRSGNFCGKGNVYTLYFDMQFSQPFASSGTSSPGAYVTFDTASNQTVLAKVGVSYVSAANAAANLAAENPGWDFTATETAAHAAWNAVLGKVQIGGGTAAQQAIFYTALYHAMLHPNVFSDDNGQYLGVDGKVHTVDSGHAAFYTNFSGWDIYRTQAQLEALVDPQAASDTAQSLVDDYAQGGMLPKWLEDNGETYVMAGDPADAVLADYYAFGATDFDASTALSDMVAQATTASNIRPGLSYLSAPGYLPADGSYGCCNFQAPVSTTLEYDVADFAISAFAGALGNSADQQAFVNRAQDWRNVLNPDSGLDQPRDASGIWTAGFDGASSNGFDEGDSWIYTGMVPFDVAGLAAAKGGNTATAAYLGLVLRTFTGASGYAFVGNEPSIELPWEYDYISRPWRTQATIRQIQDQIWTDTPAGLADGNDDLGTMSAWYVWSALGMYPITPGTATLALGSPIFPQAVITLPSGATLTVDGNGAADSAPYVQSATWNGSPWSKAYAPAAAITSGGTLSFTLGTSANTTWASSASAAPPSYGGNVVSPPGPQTGAVVSSGLCLNDRSSVTTNGNPVQGSVCNGAAAQEWTIATDGTIRALGKCLNVGAGALIDLSACSGTGTQQWKTGSGGALVNPTSGQCLDGTTAATQLQLAVCDGSAAQDWQLPAVAPERAGAITASASSDLCVTDRSGNTANGNPVEINACNSGTAQYWTMEPDGTLQALGKCMDVSGELVELNACNGTGTQTWRATTSGQLISMESGQCLTDPGSASTQLQLAVCDGGAAQDWVLPT
jgi:predicted alpha-1,2-mannosidase